MKRNNKLNITLPPRLTMDEYAEFIFENMAHCDLELAAKQKEIEEQILKPFQIKDPCGL